MSEVEHETKHEHETKLSEVLKVTISVTPDLKHCGSSCMFLAYGHDELDEEEVICTCKAFSPNDWQSHTEAIAEGRHRLRDAACIAMFGPNKSYAEINGDWRYGNVAGPGSETNGVDSDPVAAYLRTPKMRMDVDKDQLALPLTLPTVIPKTVYDDADADADTEQESPIFTDEEDRDSESSESSDAEAEADPMSKPVPCSGKGWRWYGQDNTYPKYGTVIDAYGYFFNRDYREVSLKVIEQVVVTEIDHEAAKAAGIDPKHGFGRPIADPDGCVEIVAYRISVRRGRKPVSK